MPQAATHSTLARSTRNAVPIASIWPSIYALMDIWRRAQGDALAALGYDARESDYRIIASNAFWRLREYSGSGAGPVLLIVAAPIKRPYIWDFAPSASVVRLCLQDGAR
ncbi:MAG: hypothetical protein WAW96_17915, partial [Alphaproteobacteria bacterium]